MTISNVIYKNFKLKINDNNLKKIRNILQKLIKSPNEVLFSLSSNYKDSFDQKFITSLKKYKDFRLIGMGGSILGAKAIYNFLTPKITKFEFIDSFSKKFVKRNKKKNINLIISKSGNTLETISNVNVLVKKSDKNIFITEKKSSFLLDLAYELKSKIINHNNYIGGRYSVLSEVGMLPANLMGYKSEKFRRLNYLIKNKFFFNSIIKNVSNILILNKKKTNSVIINYDQKSNDFFKWYQQLTAESLGKNKKGFLPIISTMPQDNHSLMQYFLDGNKNSFFTLFFCREKDSLIVKSNKFKKKFDYLNNKSLNKILFSQFSATEKVFNKKKIPFRSFIIDSRNEETLGELFTFFILETILLGMAMDINPFDQPAVELIKKETKKFLI